MGNLGKNTRQCVDVNNKKKCYHAEKSGQNWFCRFAQADIKEPKRLHWCNFFIPIGTESR